MSTWQSLRTECQRATAIMSCCTNALLITLIYHFSPKAFGAYRYLMVYMSVFELAYAIIDLTLRPEVMTRGTFWLVAFDSNQTFLPFSLQYFCLLIWCGSFGVSMANFGLHFLFRYFVLAGENIWTSSRRIWAWFAASVVFGTLWGAVTHYGEKPSKMVDDLIQTKIEHLRNVPIREVVYVGFSLIERIPGTDEKSINWTSTAGLLTLTILIGFSFFAMSYYGSKCYLAISALSAGTRKSSKAKSLQSQLFFALVFQTSIPMILMHFPCSLVLLSTLFDATEEYYGNILTITIALFPAIDPLPSVIIIQPYRCAITGCFKKIFCRKKPTQTKSVESSAVSHQMTNITTT